MELLRGLGTVIEGTAAMMLRNPSPPKALPPNFFRLPTAVKVHFIQDATLGEKQVFTMMETLKKQIPPVAVGFDVELDDNNNVALMQLSSEMECVLLHLCHMDSFPVSLKHLLEDCSIFKVGVGVVNDGKQIWQSFAVHTRGLVDLRPLAQHHGFEPRGLADLAKNIVGATLNKNSKIRCSKWGDKELSEAQIEYAALDAWIGHKIFSELNNRPPVANNAATIADLCNIHVDTRDTYAKAIKQQNPNKPAKISLDPNELGHPVRKSQLYYNCQLMSPEGTILCKCDLKKINWYLDRNLGEIVAQDPLTLKFNFAPKGMGHAGDPYYMSSKTNECVGCGAADLLSRHSIIPHSYRAHLPPKYKSRTSHDIVLLCQKCQHIMALTNGRLRQAISAELAPHIPPAPVKVVDPEIIRVRSAASVLLKKKDTIPSERLEEVQQILKTHYDKEELTAEDIQIAANLASKASQEYHEDEEIAKLLGSQGHEVVMQFVKRWRMNFLDSLKPQKMPQHWDVNHEY